MRDETKVHEFPPGRYYVGDPCYVIDNTDWDILGENTAWFGCDPDKLPVSNYNDGVFEFNGHKCFAYHTQWGDGVYTFGRMEFGVDAGLLSVIPVEAIKDDQFENAEGLGKIFEFKVPFKVWYEEGIFYFGHVRIDTN